MYVQKNSDLIKGQILMGSTLLRNTHTINDNGKTLFDYKTPTLQLSGLKDGLLRISRGAEAFWHSEKNIDDSQKGMFPVNALDDVSHASFMDSTMIPDFVKKSDLKADIDEITAHNEAANAMTAFISGVLGISELSDMSQKMKDDTEDLLKPFLDMMEQETLYSMKAPCYNDALVNPDDIKCAHGSQWTKTAQKIMGGDISWADADIVTNDNFHQVYTMPPAGHVHLPETTSCDDPTDGAKCTLKTISVTENYYNRLDQSDTGKSPIAANEMKAKLLSRQSIQTAAGNKTANFHELDEEGNRCADIN